LLREKGRFVFFEQTGPRQHQGEHWIRRTNNQYINIAEKNGFKLIRYTLITFSAHQFFERFIAKWYRKYFIQGKTYEEKCIKANRSKLFRFLSRFFLFFSFFPIRAKGSGYGYTLFEFEKRS
jgi:hypothetical protein